MLVILRAATHLDFTPIQVQPASRYGEAVATYYTLAWFDRYLRGLGRPGLARDGHRRLLASVFDNSADIHAISTGSYEADGNRPHRIGGMPVCDRLSFYFRSRVAVSDPATRRRAASEDLRRRCAVSNRIDAG